MSAPSRRRTIAGTYAHIVRNADEDINQRLFRRPRLDETTWRGRNGLTPGLADFDPAHRIQWAPLRAYGAAVAGFVIETVDALTEADLEREADLSTPDIAQWRGIDIIRLTVGHHVRMHGGEIAVLKGLQGMRGYVGGLDTQPAP